MHVHTAGPSFPPLYLANGVTGVRDMHALDPDAILSAAQFNADGSPKTALGQMMADLGVKTLTDLSHMIPDGEKTRKEPHKVSPSWVLVYRDLCEWAVLYERICYNKFATDTLIVRDGLLRSKLFRGDIVRSGLVSGAFGWVMLDASAHTAEETLGATVNVPRGIVRSVLVSGAFGWVMLAAVDPLALDCPHEPGRRRSGAAGPAGTGGVAVPLARAQLACSHGSRPGP
jgi:hypothetical protein